MSDDLRQLKPNELAEEFACILGQTVAHPFREEPLTSKELEIIGGRITDRIWYLQKCAESREAEDKPRGFNEKDGRLQP